MRRKDQLKQNTLTAGAVIPTGIPSSAPSMAPSHDPRPTLEIVRERDEVRCGLHASLNDVSNSTNAFIGLTMDLVSSS